MAWSFNVFTGNLDQTGSSGAVVFEGEEETFDALPVGIGDPPVGSSYLVRTSTGVWLVNRRQAGIWIRRNNTGVRATDWEYGGDYPVNSVAGKTGNVTLANTDITGLGTASTKDAPTTGNASSSQVVLGNDTRLTNSRTPTSHAASHAAGIKASYNDQVAGMTANVFIRANNAGTAGNSITLTFDGVDDIDTVLEAWNAANTSNTAELVSGDGSQVPDDLEEITLSGGVAVGNDPVFDQGLNTTNSPTFVAVTAKLKGDQPGVDEFFLTGNAALLRKANNSECVIAVQRYNTNDPDSVQAQALLGCREVDAYLQSFSANFRIEKNGGALADISVANAVLTDASSAHAATFDAQDNLTDNRTYDLPDRSGELMIVGDAPASHAHGNLTNDGKVGPTSGLPLVTTTAGAVTTLALGTANQVLRTKSDLSGVEFADPSGGGVTGAAASAADVLGVSGANITGVDAGSDKIVFWDDSASELTYLTVGSGLSLTNTELTATASGGSKTYTVFTATDNQPPATDFATLDQRNSVACLDFSDTATESAVFVGIMPEAASLGSGLIVRLHWMGTAITGNVRWSVAFERGNTDLDADSFDTATAATATTNGTSGIVTVTAITCTSIDSIAAGDLFRLRVQRLGADAADTMTGAKGCELVAVEVRSAA